MHGHLYRNTMSSRDITISTNKGPISVIPHVNFDAFVEEGQYNSTRDYLVSIIRLCNKPDSPELDRLIAYCNRLTQCRNKLYPTKPIDYITVRKTSVMVAVKMVSHIPGIPSAPEEHVVAMAKKQSTTWDDLQIASRGMTEEEQLAILMKMTDLTEQFVSGGRPDEKHHDSAFRTTKEVIHGIRWSITRYADGSSCVNGTFISDRANPIDTVQGGIHGEAPYCFLIGLFHDNPDFMQSHGYRSPNALLTALKRAGKIVAPGRMFERDSILPVAQFLKATVYVVLLDRRDRSFDDGVIGNGPNPLSVRLVSLKERHYRSGTE